MTCPWISDINSLFLRIFVKFMFRKYAKRSFLSNLKQCGRLPDAMIAKAYLPEIACFLGVARKKRDLLFKDWFCFENSIFLSKFIFFSLNYSNKLFLINFSEQFFDRNITLFRCFELKFEKKLQNELLPSSNNLIQK